MLLVDLMVFLCGSYMVAPTHTQSNLAYYLQFLLSERWHAHNATCNSVESFKISPDGKTSLLLKILGSTISSRVTKRQKN